MFNDRLNLSDLLSDAGFKSIANAIKGSPIIHEAGSPAVSMSHTASSNNVHLADERKVFINLCYYIIEC